MLGAFYCCCTYLLYIVYRPIICNIICMQLQRWDFFCLCLSIWFECIKAAILQYDEKVLTSKSCAGNG